MPDILIRNLPPDTHERLKEAATDEGLSLSAFIRAQLVCLGAANAMLAGGRLDRHFTSAADALTHANAQPVTFHTEPDGSKVFVRSPEFAATMRAARERRERRVLEVIDRLMSDNQRQRVALQRLQQRVHPGKPRPTKKSTKNEDAP